MKDRSCSMRQAILHCSGFIALFLAVLTVLTLIYVPKWKGLDAEQMRGLYQEEDNSIDVLMLGSCNMYSSYSPVIAYEQYGLTSYVYACPDQELVISYHYLKEALKTQDIKVVVLEALFLTCEPTQKREYYNRTAVEYLKPSLNKAQLILSLGAMESEYMQTVDSSAPDKLLTYAGYFFPLLRYHGREDVTMEDIKFHIERDDYSKLKGGKPLYSYLKNDTYEFAYVQNGSAVRDTSREYFEKIQDLCEEEGIELLLVKSPNYYRWDDEATNAVTEFAKERNVPFIDFHKYTDFVVSDYSSTTGRLNIYGMKRFTEHLCDYLVENYELPRNQLTEENGMKWNECVELLHDTANKKGMTIDEGQLYRIINEKTGIRIFWNRCLDGTSYTVQRCNGKDGTFDEITTTNETSYLDEDVLPGHGYTYRIVPNDGKLKGVASNELYYLFVDAPAEGTATNKNGTVLLSWDESQVGKTYHIMRKSWDSLNYSYWDETEKTTYNNLSCSNCVAYNYRIRTKIVEEDETYYSAALTLSTIPITTPQIVQIAANNNGNTIQWKKISGGTEYEIYRRANDQVEFALYDTISPSATSYTDDNVEPGTQYFYKIVLTKNKAGIESSSNESNTVGIYARG